MKRLPVLQTVPAALKEATRPNRDGSPWYARVLRITSWRIVSQAVFFGLFIFLLWVTWFSRLGGYPASLFLELDRRLGPKGLRIVGLNSDGVLGLNVAEAERDAWIREQGIRYPNAALDPKTRAAFAQNIFPAFFLVGRDGRIQKLVLNERSLDELEKLALPLLEQPMAAGR